MPTDRGYADGESPNSLSRRFWSLVLLILTLTVISSAVAVWSTATPFLNRMQKRMIAEQAGKDARSLQTRIREVRNQLSFISGQPDVVSVAMGYVENDDVVRDFLATTADLEGIQQIVLYDSFAEELARHDFIDDHSFPFTSAEVSVLHETSIETPNADTMQQNRSAIPRRIAYTHFEGEEHLLIAVPVLNQGFAEGVMVAHFKFRLEDLFPPNEIARHTSLQQFNGEAPAFIGEDVEIVPIEGGDLSLILIPDRDAVASAGRTLLFNSVGAISGVLIVAFASFAWLGRTTIINPHIRLSEQKKELAELASVAENANDSIIVTDIDGLIVWANPAFEALSGYCVEEVRGKSPGSFLQGPDTDPEERQRIRSALEEHRAVKAELLNYRKNGDTYWISINVTPLYDDMRRPYGFMAIENDTTKDRAQRDEIIQAKQEIELQALHDPLTRLPNRRALDEEIEKRRKDGLTCFTIVRIDLDHFKYVNDTLGHAAGDFVLEEVARILRSETRPGDLPARVGGDEFILLLCEGSTSQDGLSLAERILQRVRQPMRFDKKPVRVGASFGVASTNDGLLAVGDVIVGADSALYDAKDNGRNCVKHYDAALHEKVLYRRSLAKEIRRAITAEEFEPYFQPQFDAQTHEICGVETLGRWLSPVLGLVTPDDFLSTARQLSIVEEIDDIIFRKALRLVSRMSADGIKVPKISFNVTADRLKQLVHSPTIRDLGPDHPQIAFEVLESVLVEEQTDDFLFALDDLRERGFQIEVDDFGSGHASIVGLMQLQPDVMKIDRRLVMPIIESETSAQLLRNIVDMASTVGVRVTAEGVETEEHASYLSELGCDTLQGYFFSRPLEFAKFREFCATYRPGTITAVPSAGKWSA